MTEQVQYELSLKDMLTGKLHEADGAAHKLEGTLHHVGERLLNIAEGFGVSFGLYKGFEFMHESIEVFEKLEKASAKIEANLRATGEAAGIGFNEINKMGVDLSSKITATRSDVMDMQSQLLTFPAITKEVFGESMGLVADIAAQTNHGLSETAIMYGKALNDPTQGLQKMMRYGVMFTNQEKEKITALQESGHLIEAQKFMMEAIAHSGYGGVAEAMFDADPLARYNKAMEQLQIEVGEAATAILRFVTPALENFIKGIRDAAHWVREHWSVIKELTLGIGAAILVFKAVTIAVSAWTSIVMACEAATYALLRGNVALSTSFITSINPIGLIAVAVGALVLIFEKLGDAINAAKIARDGFLKDSRAKEEEYLKSMADTYGGGRGGADMAANKEKGELQSQLMDLQKRLTHAEGDQAKSINDQITETLDKMNVVDRFQQGLLRKPGVKKEAGTAMVAETKGAKGAKNLNITVNIGSLVKDFRITTQNLMESSKAIKEKITEVLTDALNDSQHVAGA